MPSKNQKKIEEIRKKQSKAADKAIKFLQNAPFHDDQNGEMRKKKQVEFLNWLDDRYDFTPEQIRDIFKLPDPGLNSLKDKLADTTIKAKLEEMVREYSKLDTNDTSEENDNNKISLLNEILKLPDKFLADFLKKELPSGMFEAKRTIEGDLEKVKARFTERYEAGLAERFDKLEEAKINLRQQISKNEKNVPNKYTLRSKYIGKKETNTPFYPTIKRAKKDLRDFMKYGTGTLKQRMAVTKTLSKALVDTEDKFTQAKLMQFWIGDGPASDVNLMGAFKNTINAQVKLEKFEKDNQSCLSVLERYQSVTGKNTKTGGFVNEIKTARDRVIQGNVRLINQPESAPEKPSSIKNKKK